jgi:hypothetical protein
LSRHFRQFRGLTSITPSLMQRRCSRRIQDQNKPIEPKSEREESPLTDLDDESEQPVSPPNKLRRKTQVVEPVVYDIPPVESKTTTYRGVILSDSWSCLVELKLHTLFSGRLGYVSHRTCVRPCF